MGEEVKELHKMLLFLFICADALQPGLTANPLKIKCEMKA